MVRNMMKTVMVAGVIAALTAIVPGTANATVPGQVDVCNDSNRGVGITFPERGGLSSTIISPRTPNGPCVPFHIGSGNRGEKVEVYYVNPRQLIGSFTYTPSRGAAVFVYGNFGLKIYK